MVLIGGGGSQTEPDGTEPDGTEPDGTEPDGTEPGKFPTGPERRRRRSLLIVLAIIGAVALIGVAAFVFGGGTSSPASKKAPAKPAGFVTYRDAADGFAISYPSTWKRVADPSVPLLVSAGGSDAMSVRVLRLQSPIDSKNVSAVEAVTNAILSAPNVKLTVLLSRSITIAGINGYYYLYTFPAGQQQGVHAHYFLFQGRKLIILVFQALPLGDFKRLAPIFDQVSASLRSNPAVLGPAPTVPSSVPSTTGSVPSTTTGSAPSTTVSAG